jgi:hypothetical protein
VTARAHVRTLNLSRDWQLLHTYILVVRLQQAGSSSYCYSNLIVIAGLSQHRHSRIYILYVCDASPASISLVTCTINPEKRIWINQKLKTTERRGVWRTTCREASLSPLAHSIIFRPMRGIATDRSHVPRTKPYVASPLVQIVELECNCCKFVLYFFLANMHAACMLCTCTSW